VTFCSENLERYFSRVITGEMQSSWAIPILQNYTQEKGQYLTALGQHYSTTPIIRDFLYYSKEKYIMEVEYAINLYPNLSDGLGYLCVIRPIPDPKEYIILNENGNVEAFTKYIGVQLNMFSADGVSIIGTNIGVVSSELSRVNKAFNVIQDEKSSLNNWKNETLAPQTAKLKQKSDRILMDADTAKEVVEKYSVIQKLFLKPIETDGRSSKSASFYYCKIENRSFGSINLKFIEIEKVKKPKNQQAAETKGNIDSLEENGKLLEEEDEEENIETLSSLPRQAHTLRDRYSTMLMKNFDNKNSNSDEENEEEIEKELEAIDVDDNNHGTTRLPLTIQTTTKGNIRTTEGGFEPLISPTSTTRRELLPKESPGRTERKNGKKKKFETRWLSIEEEEAKMKSPWLKKIVREDFPLNEGMNKIDDDSESRASRKGVFSELKVMKAYNRGLKVKYYAGPYKTFLVLLSMILITIVSLQVNVTQTVNTDLSDIQAKKGAITVTDSKNDAIIILQRIFRNYWLFGTKQQNSSSFYTSAQLVLLAKRKADTLKTISQTNQAIPSIVSLVRDAGREKIFLPNVKLYYTNYSTPIQRFANLTNFQAMNEIVSQPLASRNDFMKWTSDDLNDMSIILRNLVNDVVVSNEEITSIFFRSTENDRTLTLNTLDVTFVVVMVLLLCLISAFCLIIWVQHRDARSQMNSFVRINPEIVRQLLERLETFNGFIYEQKSFEELPDINIAEYFYQHKNLHSHGNKKRKTNVLTKDPNYSGFIKYYLSIFLKFLLALSAFIIMLIVDYTLTRALINSAHDGVVQLYNSDTLKLQLKLASPVLFDLVSENNSTQVFNLPVYTQALKTIENYKDARTRIFDILFENGHASDPIIEDIVQGNACAYYTRTLAGFCDKVGSGVSLIEMLNAIESLFTQIFQSYTDSDKSLSFLQGLQLKIWKNFIPYWSVAITLYDTISLTLSKVIDEKITLGQNRRSLTTGFFYGCLVLTYIFIYIIVFGQIREGDSSFKTVLKTMPPNAVLTNYTLKLYVLKSSQGLLDHVKNEI